MMRRALNLLAIAVIWLMAVSRPVSSSDMRMAKDDDDAAQVETKLTIEIDKESVIATLLFTNKSDKTVCIDRINGCLDGSIKNNVFTISCDGVRIPYVGRYYKRRAPGAKDVVELLPAQSIRTTVILNKAYGFLQGTHACKVSYDAFHQFQLPGVPRLLELKSNEATFSFSGKKSEKKNPQPVFAAQLVND